MPQWWVCILFCQWGKVILNQRKKGNYLLSFCERFCFISLSVLIAAATFTPSDRPQFYELLENQSVHGLFSQKKTMWFKYIVFIFIFKIHPNKSLIVKEILKHPGLPVEKIKTLSSAFKKPFINEFPFHLKCVLEHSRELVIMIK